MPLVIISGCPKSGKSSRATELKDYLENRNKQVIVVSEHDAFSRAGFSKNECFADSHKEKLVRSDMKSEAIRHLTKDIVVILDAGNYIKVDVKGSHLTSFWEQLRRHHMCADAEYYLPLGVPRILSKWRSSYRYELFCASKAACTTQCTLFCGIQKEKAWEFNEKDIAPTAYTNENFNALWLRFEEPQSNNRWDSPLFVTFPGNLLPFNEIFDALFVSKPPPPNQSTQNPPLSSTNYLFELDKITQQIINEVVSARKIGLTGPVSIKDADINVDIPSNVNAMQLNRIRRQFLNYSKMHTSTCSLDKVPQLFVQFLNSNCRK